MDVAKIEDFLSEPAAQTEMFRAAIRLGLSPESVNSAADFFVKQVPEWRAGTVYRPDLTLFIALKLARATAVDLQDVTSAVIKFGAKDFDQKAFERMATPDVWRRFGKNRGAWGL